MRKSLGKVLAIMLAATTLLGFQPVYAAEKQVVLVGSLQDELGATGEWDPTQVATQMTYKEGWYILKGQLPAGTYEYKVALGGSWDENYGMNAKAGGDNLVLTLKEESPVVFAYNDESHILCGGKSGEAEPIAADKMPRLVGDVQEHLGETSWNPGEASAIFGNVPGTDLYYYKAQLPAGNHEYKVVLGNTWEDENFGVNNGNGRLLLEADQDIIFVYNRVDNTVTPDHTAAIEASQSKERKIVLVGDLQDELGHSAGWDPAAETTQMKEIGNGFYSFTGKLPAGTYNYKIAINGSWAENYGLGGKFDGANVPLVLDKEQEVTFYYNDHTHRFKDTTSYTLLSDQQLPSLTGDLLSQAKGETLLRDELLEAFYSTTLEVKAGTYEVGVQQNGKTAVTEKVTFAKEGKVSFYFDPVQNKLIVDDGSLKEDKLYHNTWELDYRKPFEALEAGQEITLAIHGAKGDIKKAQLVLIQSKLTTGGGDEYNIDYASGKQTIYDMAWTGTKKVDNEEVDVWSKTIKINESGIYGYKFILNDMKEYGEDATPGRTGATTLRGASPFQLTVYRADYKTPDWMKEAIVYQIFPDRFYNGNKDNDTSKETARGNQPIELKNWSELPVNAGKSPTLDKDGFDCNDFFGGDLKGIEEKLDYLKSLGVTAIYVNPIMEAASNHKYDAINYEKIDSMFGTPEEFASLIEAMNKRDMELIMDGVFNHVGDDSIYFDRYGKYEWVGAYEYWARVYNLMNKEGMSQRVAEEKATAAFIEEGQKFSPYNWHKWFEVKNNQVPSDVEEGKMMYEYKPWQGATSLTAFKEVDPKNVVNPPVKDAASELNNKDLANYLLFDKEAVITSWFEKGLSGWRLDVAKEVSPEFWKAVRQKVKGMNTLTGKEPLLLGETWQDGSQFFTGDQFDSVMNYKLRFALVELFLGKGDAAAADNDLKVLMQNYPKEALYALMNMVDSHDTARAIYLLGNGKGVDQATLSDFDYALGKERLKLATAFIMGYPGAPTIFYGDEAGVYGNGDPDSRRTYPWGKEDKDLVSYYQQVAKIRRDNLKIFAYGDVFTLKAEGELYVYGRTYEGKGAIVAVNRGDKTEVVVSVKNFKDGDTFTDALDPNYSVSVKNGELKLSLEKGTARMLIQEKR